MCLLPNLTARTRTRRKKESVIFSKKGKNWIILFVYKVHAKFVYIISQNTGAFQNGRKEGYGCKLANRAVQNVIVTIFENRKFPIRLSKFRGGEVVQPLQQKSKT